MDRSVNEVKDYLDTRAGQKSERSLGSLSRALAQGQELKARQTEAGEESVFDEDRQKHLCSHPFLFTHWSVIQESWDLQLLCQETANAKCFRQKCLGCTQGCRASEFGLAVHKVSVGISHRKLSLNYDPLH